MNKWRVLMTGWALTDPFGKILGEVVESGFSGTYFAYFDDEPLGRHIDKDAAKHAVEQAAAQAEESE